MQEKDNNYCKNRFISPLANASFKIASPDSHEFRFRHWLFRYFEERFVIILN